MGIFGNKAGNKSADATPKEAANGSEVKGSARIGKDLSRIIKKPRITEKAMLGNDKNVYTFEIAATATKYDVRDAVKAIWKVTPVKVHIVNQEPRQTKSRARGRKMKVEGLKKAYVYLKKGDKIDLI